MNQLFAQGIALMLMIPIAGGFAVPASAQTPQAAQQAMTPGEVLDDLMAGNLRYASGEPTAFTADAAAARRTTASGQYPKAVILSCLDSRVPVEMIFDQFIGDVFVGRVAGNIENEDQLGSMEFATRLAGAKLVMVLGHSDCGAVKGACDNAELENLTGLLAKIRPAVDAVTDVGDDQRTSSNPAFVARVVEENVRQTVRDIRTRSQTLRQLEDEGAILIVGAVYDLESGRVALLD